MNPKSNKQKVIDSYYREGQNEALEGGYPMYTSIENKKQLEDALRSAGVFGKPNDDIVICIEDDIIFEDWDNVQHTEQQF